MIRIKKFERARARTALVSYNKYGIGDGVLK